MFDSLCLVFKPTFGLRLSHPNLEETNLFLHGAGSSNPLGSTTGMEEGPKGSRIQRAKFGRAQDRPGAICSPCLAGALFSCRCLVSAVAQLNITCAWPRNCGVWNWAGPQGHHPSCLQWCSQQNPGKMGCANPREPG